MVLPQMMLGTLIIINSAQSCFPFINKFKFEMNLLTHKMTSFMKWGFFHGLL